MCIRDRRLVWAQNQPNRQNTGYFAGIPGKPRVYLENTLRPPGYRADFLNFASDFAPDQLSDSTRPASSALSRPRAPCGCLPPTATTWTSLPPIGTHSASSAPTTTTPTTPSPPAGSSRDVRCPPSSASASSTTSATKYSRGGSVYLLLKRSWLSPLDTRPYCYHSPVAGWATRALRLDMVMSSMNLLSSSFSAGPPFSAANARVFL